MLQKRTKIVCTIGPASSSDENVRALIEAGMDMARLNFSHGTHEEHAELIKRIRAASAEAKRPIAILQDLQGPKIRVGVLPEAGVKLEAGTRVTFTTGEPDIAALRLPVTYERLHEDVKPGERILLDDGLLSATVLAVQGHDVICDVVDGGTLTSHKGVNFPESHLSISPITDKDRDDLKFGVAQGVDWVALSFVRTAQEIDDLRNLIKLYEEEAGSPAGPAPLRIIAKIEKNEGVQNIEGILETVDGIMVARGDLGIESRPETVPIVQKRLIEACLAASKPVIVATQMLDSMIRNPRPTRAEVSDIASAVMEHADAVMLSGETASGKYPVEAVKMMASVVMETEASAFDDLDVGTATVASSEDAISKIANLLVRSVDAKLVLVGSPTGYAARIVSRYRPERPIFAASGDARVRRQLCLSWGVVPFEPPKFSTVAELIDGCISQLRLNGDVASGDRIVVVAEEPDGLTDGINVVEMRGVS